MRWRAGLVICFLAVVVAPWHAAHAIDLAPRAGRMNMASRGPGVKRTQQAPVIVIDPGHPSERSSGSEVVHGTSEVHVCWLVAVRLKELLRAEGLDVVMTKSRERQLVSNRDRASIANRSRADLFLRLHCDSGRGSGFAIYCPDRQGRAFGHTGPAADVIASSHVAAGKFHAALARSLSGHLLDTGVRGDSKTYVGSRQGALTGSIFAEVPVLTVEMCVLENARDAEFVKSVAGREQLAQALRKGVLAAIGRKSRSLGTPISTSPFRKPNCLVD